MTSQRLYRPPSTCARLRLRRSLQCGKLSTSLGSAFARNTTLSIYHPVGTCAILPKRCGGVVDPVLRVYGVKGLRVVDASVMAILPSAHIQTAVYGIAERAAEIIAKEWK